ncbi:MAG TPA: hypothetical protein GXZ90_08130 [Clostridiales bacterium]|nr:hypothetical protein [Clostridiales bacterium]
MNGNTELLNFIYQNAQMGIETISQLLDIIEDKEFKERLNLQLTEYKVANDNAKKLLNDNGHDEKGISAFEKLRAYLMINMQTLTDKSSSHVAEMLIIGSNMGVIQAIKKLKRYRDAEKNILSLMDKLLKTEENNIVELKKFL